MATDFKEFVAACPTCAHNKGTNKASPGLLQPSTTPHHLWSHTSIDFVTGLPPPDGNTTILTVVDHLSKIVHFITSKKLPSAREAAKCSMCLDSTYSLWMWSQIGGHSSLACRTLLQTSANYKKMANHRRTSGHNYQVGQWVWLSTCDLMLRSDCRKLSPKFVGPFHIAKMVNPVAIEMKLP